MTAAAACGVVGPRYRLWVAGGLAFPAPPGSFLCPWSMSSPGPVSSVPADRDLVARAAAGDEGAIARLYDRYATVLYTVAYRITGERADADEVVVEAFAQAWREASRFEPGRGSVAAWLTMITRSRALDLVRARSRRDRITGTAAADQPDEPPAMGTWRGDPADSLDRTERQRQVLAALGELSPPQRQAIELAFFEGLSQAEIATRLNEPLGTVKTRVRLGMQKLRDRLRPFFFDPGP
jgi:RNA polymerase sigma-70 factor (ECF subfamily)